MTIKELVEASRSRCAHWHALDGWSPLEWAGAMAGETGEACNAAKKLVRVESQIAHHDDRLFGQNIPLPEQAERYRQQIGLEVADAVIYGLLLCDRVGVDLEECLRTVFNKKSIEYGFPERLA